MAGHNCYAATMDEVQAFVSANVTEHALAATAINWFFLCAAFYGLYKFVVFAVEHVLAVLSSCMPRKGLKKMGDWAVVTGATDGIGKATAFELARKGLNVVLISRTKSKLDTVEEELRAKYPKVMTATLAVDFSNFDDAAQARVKACLENLAVGVLVNNVGTSFPRPYYFHEAKLSMVNHLIELNINSMTRMTHIVLPGMLSRRAGAIINVSSAAGTVPQPLQSVYGGCKSFVNSYSESLDLEYRSKGVRVSSQAPMFVVSKLSKIRRPSFFTPLPKAYARASVAAINNGRTWTTPYWTHRIQFCIAGMIPRWILQRAVTSMHIGIRARARRKEERLARQSTADASKQN